MKEFNSYVKNGYWKLRPFPGATVKQLQHCAIRSLLDELSYTVDAMMYQTGRFPQNK